MMRKMFLALALVALVAGCAGVRVQKEISTPELEPVVGLSSDPTYEMKGAPPSGHTMKIFGFFVSVPKETKRVVLDRIQIAVTGNCAAEDFRLYNGHNDSLLAKNGIARCPDEKGDTTVVFDLSGLPASIGTINGGESGDFYVRAAVVSRKGDAIQVMMYPGEGDVSGKIYSGNRVSRFDRLSQIPAEIMPPPMIFQSEGGTLSERCRIECFEKK